MIKIINCETGEVIERELTPQELAQQAIDKTAVAAQMEAELEAKALAEVAEQQRFNDAVAAAVAAALAAQQTPASTAEPTP